MRRPIALIAAVIVLAAAWSALWFYEAGAIKRRLAGWVDQQRADGLVAEYGAVEVSGFPLRWSLDIAAPRMAGAGATQWEWRGERVRLELRPWALRAVPASFPGRHIVSAGAGEARRMFEISAATPNGRAELDAAGKLVLLALDLEQVNVRENPLPGTTLIARAELRLRPFRGANEVDYRSNTLNSSVRLFDVMLPAPPQHGLGQRIARAELDSSFKGQLLPGALAASIAKWRDAGGVVEVHRLALAWGPLDLDGDGTITLDSQNRPLGAFTVRVRGYNETVDAIAAAGLVRPREVAGLKVALNLFARPGQNGGASQLTVPLTAQDGRLTVAGFNLTRLEPIEFR